jgi:hypothetical protein
MGVDEGEVADLIFSVVVNVLRHVSVEYLKGFDVFVASAGISRDLTVLGSAEFVVLNPQVGFDDFGC